MSTTRARTTLLTGGTIYAPSVPGATAMAVTGGIVTWIGSDAPGIAAHPEAELVALEGAFVAPAFVDAHVHATGAGLHSGGLDLSTCDSRRACLDAIRSYTTTHPGELVWGHGWDESGWDDPRPPSRDELDEAAGPAEVYLSRIDVHSALVSTALLDAVPEALLSDGFDAQGPLSRDAHHAVRSAANHRVGPAAREAAQLAFLRKAAAAGIACVHECAGPDIYGADDLTALLALGSRTDLPDVIGYWGELGGVQRARQLGAHGAGGDLFVDGALGSRTAALCKPYADDPGNSGAAYLGVDDIAEHLVACTNAGMQAGFHVIGDAGIAAVVRGFRQAAHHVGVGAMAARRHRLEHVEMIDAEQATELGSYGVIASVQPGFDAAWGGEAGMYAQRLGPGRGSDLNPLSVLMAAGMPLAFGSDTPVTSADPWAAVRAAVHHRTPGSGISARAAFTAHTRGGWRAAGTADGAAGTLAVGADATYAVWDADELVAPSQDGRIARWSTDPRSGVPPLPNLDPDATLPRCVRTVLHGQTIYQEV